jgi:hypothetical protein
MSAKKRPSNDGNAVLSTKSSGTAKSVGGGLLKVAGALFAASLADSLSKAVASELESQLKLKCRHCGSDYSREWASSYSCRSSPSRKHIALSDGVHCVYCGRKFQTYSSCQYSPTNKHALDV